MNVRFSQLLLLFIADSMQVSDYSCHTGPVDDLGIIISETR